MAWKQLEVDLVRQPTTTNVQRRYDNQKQEDIAVAG